MKIKKKVINDIIVQAKKESPIEACGYLAAKDGVVTTVYKLTNVDKSQEHFSFDPKEQFEALRDSRSKGLEICGVYHSHPRSPARPSVEDIKLAFDPNFIYLIASLWVDPPQVKAFRIKQEIVEEENLELEND